MAEILIVKFGNLLIEFEAQGKCRLSK